MSPIPCIPLAQPQPSGGQPLWPARLGDPPPDETRYARSRVQWLAARLDLPHLLSPEVSVVMLSFDGDQSPCWGVANEDAVLLPIAREGEPSTDCETRPWCVFERVEPRPTLVGVHPRLVLAVAVVVQLQATLFLDAPTHANPGERLYAAMQRRLIAAMADKLTRYRQD